MNMLSGRNFSLMVLSLGILITHSAYAESRALNDLKINIASVQQVLTDPKLAVPHIGCERRHLAVAVLQQVFDFR